MIPLPKVIVSHPGKQHAHQLVYSLQLNKMLKIFYTGLWNNPHKFPYTLLKYCPFALKNKVYKEINKRYTKELDERLVRFIPYPEIKHRLLNFGNENFIFYVTKEFGKKVARKIKDVDYDIFIGYELSAFECFKTCKELKKITIYDACIDTYDYQAEVFKRYPEYYIKKETESMVEVKIKEIALADYILVPSLMVKQSFLRLGIPEYKLIKISYGTNLETFAAKESYRKKDSFKILFVGHIVLHKGIEFLLEAIKGLNNNLIELILVGRIGNAENLLKKYNGLYHHYPFMPHDKLCKAYQDSDIFVFPTLLEGFSQVVIEAMATGTPVIVSDKAGSHEAIREGIDGFVVPAGNVEALQEKILYCYNNREKFELIGKNARETAMKYSWEAYRNNIARSILEIWHRKIEQ